MRQFAVLLAAFGVAVVFLATFIHAMEHMAHPWIAFFGFKTAWSVLVWYAMKHVAKPPVDTAP